MEKYNNVNFRACVELVSPSETRSHGNSIVWAPVVQSKRVARIISSDAMIMPGTHMMPHSVPVGQEGALDVEALFANCFLLLGEIAKKFHGVEEDRVRVLDERAHDATLAIFALLTAKLAGFTRAVRDRTPGLHETLMAFRRCDTERVKEAAKQLMHGMRLRKRALGDDW